MTTPSPPMRRVNVAGKTTTVVIKTATASAPSMRRRNSRAASTATDAMAGSNAQDSSSNAPRRRRKCRVTVDISSCRYAIIRKCLRERDFRLVKKTGPEVGGATLLPAKWDIWWSDRGDLLQHLPRLSPFQKVNHFPSMEEICRKDFLANNLNAIYKVLPHDFDFFPQTFLIPADSVDLQAAMENGPKNATYIVKPRTLCQGKGITLIQSFAKLSIHEPCVVQRYIDNPLLIDGLKFDLRIYVLVYSVNPLKIYIFRNGLARFCTTPFQRPTKKNLSEKRMHLTNYAINKRSKDFQQATNGDGDGQASKRSLASIMKHLDDSGHISSVNVWNQICDIVIKTLLCIEPKLQSSYKSYFGSNEAIEVQWGPKCFEILGFDIMLDAAGKAWLFEVNHAPSFAGDSPLDREIKTALISSTLDIVGITNEKKRQYVRQQRAEWTKRLWVTAQPPVKQSSVDQEDNQISEKNTNPPDTRSTLESKLVDGHALEDTDASNPESESGDDEDELLVMREPKHEKVSLRNVFQRRNRISPAMEEEPRTSDFGNEFSLLYANVMSSNSKKHESAITPSENPYDRVRNAAQVNKSKLWT